MISRKTKYYFFFRGRLDSHVHFFQSTVDVLRMNGIPFQLITFLSPKMYFSQLHLIKNYRSKNFKIYMDLPKSIFSNLYFFFITLIYKKVVIHLKKRDPSIFDKLKYIFKNKLIYIYEGEGDPLIEIDYLEKIPLKKIFIPK